MVARRSRDRLLVRGARGLDRAACRPRRILGAAGAPRGAGPSSRCDARDPGSAPLLVEAALASGLRFVNPPGLLLHNRPARLPSAVVVSGYWLM